MLSPKFGAAGALTWAWGKNHGDAGHRLGRWHALLGGPRRDDIAKASAFYAELFGWEAQPGPPEAGGYTVCRKDGLQVAGIRPDMGPARAAPGVDHLHRRPATRPGPPGGSRRPAASC